MAGLILYVDNGVRSTLARQRLKELGVTFTEMNALADTSIIDFLKSNGRPTEKFPLPQYYVGNTLAWADGFKEVNELTAEQINDKIEEINASI
jgi:rhodanese-related sulfurtransferase